MATETAAAAGDLGQGMTSSFDLSEPEAYCRDVSNG